jgi:hypothetical protein
MDTTALPAAGPAEAHRTRKKPRGPLILVVLVVSALPIYWNFGLYTVQPLDALPEGGTLVVWRVGNEPFFNSPDATCLRMQGSVSLLCRGVAFGVAPTERIVLRLPYQHWAYLWSTSSETFDR